METSRLGWYCFELNDALIEPRQKNAGLNSSLYEHRVPFGCAQDMLCG
jgi:hypothetical protein